MAHLDPDSKGPKLKDTRSEMDYLRDAGVIFQCLDHGFIKLIDYMGGDSAVVQAARVSYGHGTKSVSEDTALIHYLVRNNHVSPMDMLDIKLLIRAPLFVVQQHVRHQSHKFNIQSYRYSIVPDVFYIPEETKVHRQHKQKAQCPDSTRPLPRETVLDFIKWSKENSKKAIEMYDKFNDLDLARELNRMNIPQNIYTDVYCKMSLRSALHFIQQRLDDHAQYEIRQYATQIKAIIQKWCPVTLEAFEKHQRRATTFSQHQMEYMKQVLVRKDASNIVKPSKLTDKELEQINQLFKLG